MMKLKSTGASFATLASVLFLAMSVMVECAKPLRMVQLFSEINGLYLTAYWPDGALRVDSVAYTHASTFEVHLVDGRSDQWQLRALKNNKFVAAANGGGSSCTADRDVAKGWETFTVTELGRNQIQLKTFDGHFLGIDGTSTSPLIASATEARSWETFTVVEVPQRRGVNLGSWFVPEPWMFGKNSALFANTSDAVKDLYTLSKELGPAEISRRMKQHWSTWITESDFANMAARGVNHVRIPIGYWDIVETAPYVFGGAEYIDQAVKWAAAHGISASIDLHGAPGSQNGRDHSGRSGSIDWPKSEENVKLTVKVLGMISARWGANPAVWGIEMLNEPDSSISHDLLTDFYREGYAAIRQYSDTVHVVMNSLYKPHDWTALVLPEPQYRNVVLDLHLYAPWSGQTEEQGVMDLASSWGEEIRSLKPFYPIIVGEMSLATPLSSYSAQQRQVFADIMMSSFVENAYGFMFWSYKLGYETADWAFTDSINYIKYNYLPPSVNNFCGCNSCTRTVWDTIVTDSGGSHSCGSRITWLQTVQGYSEASACQKVANEFPSVCRCDTMSCTVNNPTTSKPTTNPTTRKPTLKPTTPKPTLNPTTPKPTLKPTTPKPTLNPTTPKPTLNPTTPNPTLKPTTLKTRTSKPLRLVQLYSEINGLYLTAYWPDGALRVDSVAYSHASTFEVHLVDGRSDQWQLRALKNNKFVAAANGGGSTCTADRDVAKGWETFTVTELGNNKVQLKTFDGHFLGIDGTSTSPLIASATEVRSWETFTVVEVPQRRGVNLGSWFVPEPWMFGDNSALFANTSKAVKDLYTLSKELGPAEISRRMKQHWSTWITESDFANMAAQGINHVRIPIGYWDIVETAPYAFGGAQYIDQAIKWAAAHGISVSIDLHGAPGSQNGWWHSGQDGNIDWPKAENVKLTVKVLGMISARWGANPAVWGIEMLNEPHWTISHDLLTEFYRDGYAAIREHSDTVHVVMNSFIGPHDWTALVLPEPQYRNVVLDLHDYAHHSGLTQEQDVMDRASYWGEEIRSMSQYYPIIVGETSLATELSPYSPQQRQRFADTAMTSFVENAYGFMFWSYRLGYDDSDWAFTDSINYVKDYFLPESVPYCGCNSCTQAVWDTLVTDAGGSYSCGSRITWLQTVQGYSGASACQKVANEFPSVCRCDTMSCTMNSPTTSMLTMAEPVPYKPMIRKPAYKPTGRKPIF
ncbi:hypothetical protein HJC23_006941 [Cyclotella cryptica]|uniref:glucan 1,3-beta-glucosidase n=1 Tax=Cyclotella cryptica TaxID=29204 RepID=A0ABD3QN08_9STRA|eukprot:CCRYP_004257-RA/>CCRYP_004257-RA protein AED:0.02 eAED:0.02 QI:912/1/0.66/1/1/1/3/297/1203